MNLNHEDFDQLPVPRRYVTPAMADVWSEATRYRTWASVETCAAKALGAPREATEAMAGTPVPTPQQVATEEARTGHDVLAFLSAWRQGMDPVAHEWVHRGMTSSDLVDSALACTVTNASHLVHVGLDSLVRKMAAHAVGHQHTMLAARTHGQVAEVTTWGYRMADLTFAVIRAHGKFRTASKLAAQAKLSGPVGDYKHITSEQEGEFSRLLLGRNSTPISATQVVARDELANLVFACALIASAVERLATEVRLMSQSGIQELHEGGADHRMGSSAMPHKRNPITSENLVGLARLVRAQVGPMLEDVSLWDERDISHSSVERVALPTALILTEYMVLRAARLVEELVVDKTRMMGNVYENEAEVNSATARTWLVEQGLTDPDLAWELVKEAIVRGEPAMALPGVIGRIGRDWMRAGKIDEARFPKFAPVWTDLIDRCAVTVDRSRTDHVFDILKKINPS